MSTHPSRYAIAAMLLAASSAACFGSGSKMRGTYADAGGSVVLDLRSGGKAAITFGGDTKECTYRTSGQSLNLNCPEPAGQIALTMHDDGSLTGPPDSFMPQLRKSTR